MSRHTFLSLPVLLVLNDNSDSERVPLLVYLVHPPVLRMVLLRLLRFPDPYRMIVVDALGSGWRPTIIAVFSVLTHPLNSVVPFAFPSPFGQTMELATPNVGLQRTP